MICENQQRTANLTSQTQSSSLRESSEVDDEIIVIPGPQERLKARTQHDFYTLKHLFRNPNTFQQLNAIRTKFGIPLGGFRDPPGTTDQIAPQDILHVRQNFKRTMALIYDTETLRTLHVRTPSRRRSFQKSITSFMHEHELPARFRDALTIYVMYYHHKGKGLWPIIGTHSSRVLCHLRRQGDKWQLHLEVFGDTKQEDLKEIWPDIRGLKRQHELTCQAGASTTVRYHVQREDGENRLFLEIFASTTQEDLKAAWTLRRQRNLCQRYGLKGSHLFRYETFYREPMAAEGQYLNQVHPVTGERLEGKRDLSWHEEQNARLLKCRHGKRLAITHIRRGG